MIAVIQTGGQQFKVAAGDQLDINKLALNPGDTVEFDEVLMTENDGDIKIGAPLLEGAKVIAEVVEQKRGKKIEIIKFKRRKHHMKHMGHRQYLTTVKIKDIQGV